MDNAPSTMPAREGPLLLQVCDQVTVAVLLAVLGGAIFFWHGMVFHTPGGASFSVPEISAVEKPRDNPALYLVDINTAAVHDLILLPGIGEKTAERIILDREENGPYQCVNDLTRIRGIGAKKVAALQDYVLPISEVQQIAGSVTPSTTN